MIAYILSSFDVPFWDGNMFIQVTISFTNNVVMSFVNLLYGIEWHPHLTRFLIFWMDLSISPMCSFAAHVCRWSSDKNDR